jgi:peptide/nickel transport system ATP-binding protein
MLPDPESIFKAYPHQVSGGQKQRVMIAMALACNPDILIADEPTTALDVTVQKTILELLHTLQKKHTISLVFISHNLDVIAEIAADVLVMFRGEIVEKGPIKQIFNHPQHPYTKGLLACRPPLGKRPLRLKTIADFIDGKEIEDDSFINHTERQKQHSKLYSEQPILKTEGIHTIFTVKRNIADKPIKQYKAVNNVSFEVYPGETLGLVGESGCGKTTLGRTILRLVEPSSGNTIYKNTQVNNLKANDLRALRKNIQIIFQDPYSSLNPRITIGEAIIEPMRIHKLHENEIARKAKVAELLLKVGLEASHYGRYPHEFSGGQRQRICIARALAVEPEFIICDESVSALDVSVQAQVLNLLNNLKKEFGLTYLFISHDLSVVRYMSDRLMVMKNGEIQEMGEADEVYTNPQSEYTRLLLDAIPKGVI